MENGRVVRVFVKDGVGRGADGAIEAESLADAAADDGLACTEVSVQGDLVTDLQFLGELQCPIVCFFFGCETHDENSGMGYGVARLKARFEV